MAFTINRAPTWDYALRQITKIRTQLRFKSPILFRYALSEIILWEDKKPRNFLEDYISGLM